MKKLLISWPGLDMAPLAGRRSERKGKLGVQEAQEDVAGQLKVHLCEFRRTFSVVVEQKRDTKSTHLEYSSFLLRTSISSLPFFLIKVKVCETIKYL